MIHDERETFEGEQDNHRRLMRVDSSATPHDKPSPALAPVMRNSFLTARDRQRQRLAALVADVALTCTDDEAAELDRLITLVHAGAISARDAHERILAHQRATTRLDRAA